MLRISGWVLASSLLMVACSGKIVETLAPGMVSEDTINAESKLAYAQIISQSTLSADQRLVAMVKRVGQRIAEASGEPFEWQIELIESDELNAWCMPGGKMAVYTGILPVLQTEGALAAVMGHEVAHATKRHGRSRYAKAIENQLANEAIGKLSELAGSALCQSAQCQQLAQLGGQAGALGLAFFERKFSRGDETEADRVGQVYMARAGYDPAEAVTVWERMEQASGGSSGPEFMSTHPSHSARQDNLRSWLPEANRIYEQAAVKYGKGQDLFD